jgi:DNA polymerase-3 subunit epsilon
LNLNLKRSLAFIDLETTGVNVSTDRIVELSVLKISPNGKEEWMTTRVNPGIPIPPKTTAIHGIKDEDVVDAPVFKEVAKKLALFLEGCDLAGYNAIQVIFHKKEQRTLSAAYLFYCKKDLEGAHGSKADTAATFEVLKSQLDRYKDLENDVEKLADFSSFNNNVDFAGRIILDENGVEVFNFGKHKGKPVESVFADEPAYYSWMMNGDFPLYTKKVLTEIKLRSFGKTQ